MTVDLGSYVLQPVSNAERLREQMAETGDSLVAMGNQNIYNVTGYNDLAKLPEFQNGSWQLLKGEFPASNDIVLKCIVSEKLANANQAEIGSTIVFVNPYNTDEQFTFIVSGIYTDSAQISNNDLVVGGTADFSDRILVNYRSLKELVNSSQNNPDNVQSHTGQTISTRLSGRLSSRFILYSAQDLEAFEQQLHDKGLDAYYTLQTNADELQQSYKPLYSLRHYAITFLGIILLGGLVILIILNILHVRERKYEIGILRAIGMKKTQICLQFLMELLLVSILSILVGFGIGVTLSGPISNTLLENEMTAQQSDPGLADAQSSDYSFVINNEQSADYLDGEQSISQIYHIDTQVDFWFFLQIASIGLLMVLLSSLFSILLISRYEPLKILNNRL